MYKPFDQKTHDKYDDKAKRVAVGFLESLKSSDIKENTEESTQFKTKQQSEWVITDLFAKNKYLGGDIRIDVEVKNNWRYDPYNNKCWNGIAHKYKWDTIHIPRRKIDKPKKCIQPTHFLMFGGDYKRAALFSRKGILSSEQVWKSCWNSPIDKNTGFKAKEPFCSVPINKDCILWFYFEKGKWKNVKFDQDYYSKLNGET